MEIVTSVVVIHSLISDNIYILNDFLIIQFAHYFNNINNNGKYFIKRIIIYLMDVTHSDLKKFIHANVVNDSG